MEEVLLPWSLRFFSASPPKQFLLSGFYYPFGQTESIYRNQIGIQEGIYNALNASHEREWYPVDVDLLILLASGLTLVYVDERPERVSLIADASKFCKPDCCYGA